MKNTTKIWLIIAAFLMLSGCILFVAVMSGLQWDFAKLTTVEYEINTYEVDGAFTDISIITDTADIAFALSDKGKCKVECYEEKNTGYSVSVEDNTLNIKAIDEKTVQNYIGNIGFNFSKPKITVYLPEREFDRLVINESTGDVDIPKDFSFKNVDISLSTGDVDFSADTSASVKIRTSTGDVQAEDISVGTLEFSVATGKVSAEGVDCQGTLSVSVSTGDVLLSHIRCKNFSSTGSTGDISLTDVIAAENVYIERSSGDVYFDSCDAHELFVESSTGDVTGTLLSEKVFHAHSRTGKVDLPKTLTGGLCEITSSTGDIRVKIK